MISKEILAKVRKLEIRTKGLVNNLFGGEYHSAFKGRGMTFSEVRPYQYGDDVRQIDWNVTARTGDPHVKLFEEEREQTLMLVVDVSASGRFGSKDRPKIDLITELCAVMAFSAISNNDKVGMVLFSDRIEKVVMPRKGRSHVLRLIRDLYATVPIGTGTDIGGALSFVNRILNRRSIMVLVSDFMTRLDEKALRITHRKHDLVSVHVSDPLEVDLPNLGFLPVRDAESGEVRVLPTFLPSFRRRYRTEQHERLHGLDDTFSRLHLDAIRLDTTTSYIQPMRQFFQKRASRA
jgi:uncharacterized protein (DUF58 family)